MTVTPFESIIKDLPVLLGALLISILFLQSGLDKVFDRNGNLEWLTGHFSKTFVAGMVPFMLTKIMIIELAAGAISGFGILYYLATGSKVVIFWGVTTGALAIVGLFFGQRIAKDYAGAAVLIPYFILLLFLMLLSNPYTATLPI